MPKVRITLVHEYEPDPKNYPDGTDLVGMVKTDKAQGLADFLVDCGIDQFDVKYEIVEGGWPGVEI